MKTGDLHDKNALSWRQRLPWVASAMVCVAGQVAMGFGEGPHADVATKAIDNYLVWVNQDNDARVGEVVSTYSTQIVAGSVEEDGGLRQRKHFWDPDTGAGLTYLGITFPSALVYAEELYAKALAAYDTEDYSEGFDAGAYHYLGRVIHLIGDMSVPAHVLLDEHVLVPDTYETYMGTAANYENIPATGIEEGDLEHLMRYVAETADDYDSDDMDGETSAVDNTPPDGLNPTELGMIATACYPLAIRAAAGVITNFYNDVAPITEIDFPLQGAITSGLAAGDNHGVHFEIFAHSCNGTFNMDTIDIDYSEDIIVCGWSDVTDLPGLSDSATYTYDWENTLNNQTVWLKGQGKDTGGCRSVVHTRSISIDSTPPVISNATR